jgi:hypothetical protein
MADRSMTRPKETTPMTEIDTDALTALEQAATPAPWAHEHDGGHIVHGPESTVAEAEYAPDAKLIAAMRNQLPALLNALAREQWLRENADRVCDNAVAATREIAEQRDAAQAAEKIARERCASAERLLAEEGRRLHETLLRTPSAAQAELQGIWDAREAR